MNKKLQFLLIKAIDYLCKSNNVDYCFLVQIYGLIYPEDNCVDLVKLNFLQDQLKTLHSFGIVEDNTFYLTRYSFQNIPLASLSSSGIFVCDLIEIIDSDIDYLMKRYGND